LGVYDIKLIFELGGRYRGLLRLPHGLAWYCSTSRIGPLPLGGVINKLMKLIEKPTTSMVPTHCTASPPLYGDSGERTSL